MKEYSLKLTASELKKYIKTKGYSTSLLPIMELSRDSYIEFLDRFISLNDWEGYNHRLLDWKNFSEYLKNTLKKSKPHSYNGVNIESFTMAANIDSIKVLDESIVVRLIRVQNTTTNVIELKTFGDLIIAAYVAFLFTHELGLSQASINIITVKRVRTFFKEWVPPAPPLPLPPPVFLLCPPRALFFLYTQRNVIPSRKKSYSNTICESTD